MLLFSETHIPSTLELIVICSCIISVIFILLMTARIFDKKYPRRLFCSIVGVFCIVALVLIFVAIFLCSDELHKVDINASLPQWLCLLFLAIEIIIVVIYIISVYFAKHLPKTTEGTFNSNLPHQK